MTADLRPLVHANYWTGNANSKDHKDWNHSHDFQAYFQPLNEMHHAFLHGYGVVHGLEVNLNPATKTLDVSPGVGIDRKGRLVILAPQTSYADSGHQGCAHGRVATTLQLPQRLVDTTLVNAPVQFPLNGVTQGVYLFVIETVLIKDDISGAIDLHEWVPWIHLVAGEGEQEGVVLAKVTISADLAVALSADRRQVVDQSIREIRLINSTDQSNSTVDDLVAGTIGPNGKDSLRISSDQLDVTGNLTVSGDLKLQEGVAVNEFSDDPNLTDNSDRAVPTEKAVKEYIDNLLVGSVAAFATTTPPAGWLECNGQNVSRTTHARLFARIGTTFGRGDGSKTFNLPDLRGLVIRAWDHGRGIDPDRAFGSPQGDAFQNHKHGFSGASTIIGGGSHAHVDHSDTIRTKVDLQGGGTIKLLQYNEGGLTWAETHSHNHRPSGEISNPTSGSRASETRIKNLALMYCIKV